MGNGGLADGDVRNAEVGRQGCGFGDVASGSGDLGHGGRGAGTTGGRSLYRDVIGDHSELLPSVTKVPPKLDVIGCGSQVATVQSDKLGIVRYCSQVATIPHELEDLDDPDKSKYDSDPQIDSAQVCLAVLYRLEDDSNASNADVEPDAANPCSTKVLQSIEVVGSAMNLFSDKHICGGLAGGDLGVGEAGGVSRYYLHGLCSQCC